MQNGDCNSKAFKRGNKSSWGRGEFQRLDFFLRFTRVDLTHFRVRSIFFPRCLSAIEARGGIVRKYTNSISFD